MQSALNVGCLMVYMKCLHWHYRNTPCLYELPHASVVLTYFSRKYKREICKKRKTYARFGSTSTFCVILFSCTGPHRRTDVEAPPDDTDQSFDQEVHRQMCI